MANPLMTPALHPLCTLFPRLEGVEFAALVADIKANGQREPIVMFEGMVLDGGNRLRACIEAGVKPEFKDFEGQSIVSFVLSANLHRRHMTPGQQAAIVASAQDWSKAQEHGGARRGHQAATLPLETVADRAAQAGASERTQRMADKVAKQSPELAAQVGRGEISLPKALDQIKPQAAPSPPPTAPAPASVPATAAPADEEDFHDDIDLMAELDAVTAERDSLRVLVAQDDKTAEALKWQHAYDVAQRRCGEHQTTIQARDKQISFLARQLERCGKAVGVADQDLIAPAVERLARAAKATA
jgi:hypothetical protein